MAVVVIYNPACGDRTADAFFADHVFPLLEANNIQPALTVRTERDGHAGQALVDFLETYAGESLVHVVLGSGDGTLHEIINALSFVTFKGDRANTSPPSISFSLVPCGTANALYASLFPAKTGDKIAYRLQSLHSFIARGPIQSLTLSFSSLSSPPSSKQRRPKVAVSAVVTSTSLHASILDDSEKLRESIPGLERFKVAAAQNMSRWYHSYAKLLPLSKEGTVQVYDPQSNQFVTHDDSDEDTPFVDVYGPFAYFLSTVNVDRLEPEFRITPLNSQIPPQEPSLDVIMVRPERDPTFTVDSEETRAAFAKKTMAVLMEAYKDGNHVNLRYNSSGEISPNYDGPTVVEYVRCGGWEWMPDDTDEKAHLLCCDGTIFNVQKEGRVVCLAARASANAGFTVHV